MFGTREGSERPASWVGTRAWRGGFLSEVLLLVGGTGVAQVVALVAAPLLTRLYSPREFGLLTVFLAVSTFVAVVVTGRFEAVVMLPKSDGEAASLVKLALLTGVTTTILATAIGSALPTGARAALGVADLGGWLAIAVLAGGAAGVIATGFAWLNRVGAFRRMAAVRMSQSICVAGLSLGFGSLGVGSGLLLGQTLAAVLVGAGVLLSLSGVVPRADVSLRTTVRRHSTAPRLLLPTALLDTATVSLPVFLIVAWFGPGTAGQFGLAWRVLGLPLALVGVAVGQVFYRRFSRAASVGERRALLKRTWLGLVVVGTPPAVLLIVVGEPVFGYVFGSEWREAGRFSAALAPMLLAMLVSSPTSSSYLVLGLQKLTLGFGLATVIYRPALLAVGLWSGSLVWALTLWSAAEVLQIGVYNVILLRELRRSEQSPRASG